MSKKHGFSRDSKNSQTLAMKEIQGFSLNFSNLKILKIPEFHALVSTDIKGLQRSITMFGRLRDRTPISEATVSRIVGENRQNFD